MKQRSIYFTKYLASGASFMAASEPNPAFWGKRSMVSLAVSTFSVSADVLFASASAEIGIDHSSSVKAQHIIFRQAIQRWTGSYQIRMLELTEAEILDPNQTKVTFFFAFRPRFWDQI
jgi:hypothetical protein